MSTSTSFAVLLVTRQERDKCIEHLVRLILRQKGPPSVTAPTTGPAHLFQTSYGVGCPSST